ncbi:uncharacterized protein LOC121736018 isoform X2 [Aricia agestis]|nr:uncharacterized protein LOC121736018 isoform X2 [Aricia agestis]
MEDKKIVPATQQPSTQQHIMAHHVHPDQIYAQQNTQIAAHITNQPGQLQMNGGMHQLMQNQYHSNMNARSPLLENRHDLYGTGHNPDYNRHYGANDNHNYPQSPPRFERQEFQPDQNVNHELLHNIPKGYNAEVYQDYLKRNPPKDSNQIYQNHQLIYRPNVNQYGSKPYLPYSNRIGPQSNTELLRRQYNEIQQMKMQQQMHYQNQAQMHQQQKFAERQLLLQQIHGVQPPPNLQNSIYSDSSYRDLDRYSSKNDFKEYSSSDINKELERYARDNEFIEMEKQQRQYQEAQWQANQIQKEELSQMQEERRQRMQQEEISKSQSPPSDYNSQMKKSNNEPTSPMKSSESSTPSIKSPSSESRRSSSGNQALRSPIAQRIPSAPVTMAGILYKQGSDGLKVWRKRWFVLSEYCLFYYKSQEEEKLLGSVLLPSYRVSACTPEDKVMRKFSFKLEHANMRTYVLAALDQESMLKWVKMLTMAALMQNPNDQRQNQSDRAAAKPEEEETPGPTYANAPPKPRRSNDGYSSPSPEMYDPNYDLLKQPASHYSQGQPSHTRYQDTQQLQQESTYIRSPQTTQPQQHMKRPYDMNLPLTNVAKEKLENNQTQYKSNTHSPYIDDRSKATEQLQQERNEAMYEKQKQYNPFLQDYPQTPVLTHQQRHMRDNVSQGKNSAPDVEKSQVPYNENYNAKPYTDPNTYAREVYGELNRANKQGTSQPTQDAYGRTVPVQPYTTKLGDYEDIYAEYGGDNQYGKTYVKSPMTPQTRDNISVSSHKSPQEQQTNYPQEKVFSGPSVLRRKKMQASGIQPPMPRPHSADFLEYEMKNENVKQATTTKIVSDYPKQPQRPKSSLDINSFYDPSSDRYYSEESYAEKMRKTAQLLQQQGLPTGNIQIPLAKYASGLVEKQLHSPYSQGINNNYETGFGTSRSNKDNVSYTSKYSDLEGIHSNWTLKEKDLENQKMRSGSVISDHSNMSGARDANRFDQNPEGFIRSASARVPSSNEREGDKKIHQKEESMKRLLEWKQRMLQSPLTRKSTPATISLARSLNQSRQSVRSDQYKPKAYGNASYNSYSSDDEEETSDTGLQIPKEMQAGRSHLVNVTVPIISRPITSHVLSSTSVNNSTINDCPSIDPTETFYENISCTTPNSIPNTEDTTACDKTNSDDPTNSLTEFIDSNQLDGEANECDNDGYETQDSEAESETQNEYTDNDLDEVLLASDIEAEQTDTQVPTPNIAEVIIKDKVEDKSETPPIKTLGEDHYLPMSPRKISTIEPAHKTILDNIADLHNYMPHAYEDNPYVEMNLGNEEDDMQTYELVCINNSKPEPVYMELSNVLSEKQEITNALKASSEASDTASNFADTKEHTLKRLKEKNIKEKTESSDADDEVFRDVTIDEPFSRFSISDTFRPASYYLSGSRNTLNTNRSSDSESTPLRPLPNSPAPGDGLMDEELSKYILDKLDKSDISQDSSILKMLTCENQKMHKIKKKTTSLMIYGSHTSIHDTLTRGEKIRHSRASLTNVKRLSDAATNEFINTSIPEIHNSSSGEGESLHSYNADRGSSRLSLESDISSRFENVSSHYSPDVRSLTDDSVDLRRSIGSLDFDDSVNKRRPLSDDSLFSLLIPERKVGDLSEINLDMYLESLQPGTSQPHYSKQTIRTSNNYANNPETSENPAYGRIRSLQSLGVPITGPENKVSSSSSSDLRCQSLNTQRFENIQGLSHNNSLSADQPKAPFDFYCKSFTEDSMHRKNLNQDIIDDKIKEFENEKNVLKSGLDMNDSSTTTGFHSRESSSQSAPYYYSDLSSQEHINALHTTQFLKNTNLHRKLNNQRRRGPSHKKNDISHIHNPIHSNHFTSSSYDLAASARSVSVEFLSAVEKNPEFDLRNIYESTGTKVSKIPESIRLIPSLISKQNASFVNNEESSSSDSNALHSSSVHNNPAIKVSRSSMSSHCSENSSNTVYYDAEADASGYENVMFTGDHQWDENTLRQENLRWVSHRHARSMDDLDTVENIRVDRSGTLNSIKRVKNNASKISRNVTYVNCDIQEQVQRRLEANSSKQTNMPLETNGDNDEYVSLANASQVVNEPIDEGVYEQLAVGSSEYMHTLKNTTGSRRKDQSNKRRFEIDRENLRQWDLMSSGLMKGGIERVRSIIGGSDLDAGAVSSTNNGTANEQ